MSVVKLKRCVVSFKTESGGIDCRTVLLRDAPQSHWHDVARSALYRQHDIPGAVITNIRICSDENKSEDRTTEGPAVAVGGAV